jgi:hypothetical protein
VTVYLDLEDLYDLAEAILALEDQRLLIRARPAAEQRVR